MHLWDYPDIKNDTLVRPDVERFNSLGLSKDPTTAMEEEQKPTVEKKQWQTFKGKGRS